MIERINQWCEDLLLRIGERIDPFMSLVVVALVVLVFVAVIGKALLEVIG